MQDLRHQYGDRVALAGVSFDVRPAEIFGLLGPNGSGKTTTFRILSTLMLPSGGRALIMGHDVAREPALVRRNIGVVFQAQSIDIKLSAEENLMLIGHIYGLRGAALKKRVSEMLGRVGLADRAKEKAETFSGGMQRRLELAKGLLHHPSVLLLDEPTTGLDPGARRDLWQYLHILRDEERVTVLVTTHLMEEAERCDRLAIYANGSVVALGTPAELKSEIGGDVILLESDAARTRWRNASSSASDCIPRCSIIGCGWKSRAATASSPTWSRHFPARSRASRCTSRAWKMCSSAAPAIASGPKRTTASAKGDARIAVATQNGFVRHH